MFQHSQSTFMIHYTRERTIGHTWIDDQLPWMSRFSAIKISSLSLFATFQHAHLYEKVWMETGEIPRLGFKALEDSHRMGRQILDVSVFTISCEFISCHQYVLIFNLERKSQLTTTCFHSIRKMVKLDHQDHTMCKTSTCPKKWH
jgi:hypothetical protein